ncbi:MAG: DUF2277 domain-containing protein [Calditrichae bacterium]|nr:DUF2277 domain-containing protein [Calditrichota bacterium]MCB9058099.1 DUF2277 domain-containing protein [Calditrichia bacterium]
MCRNIKKLRFEDRTPSDEELHDAALQFVRKISGFRKPSKINQDIFDQTVQKIASVSRKMFDGLEVRRA